jgi:hypothetical protein
MNGTQQERLNAAAMPPQTGKCGYCRRDVPLSGLEPCCGRPDHATMRCTDAAGCLAAMRADLDRFDCREAFAGWARTGLADFPSAQAGSGNRQYVTGLELRELLERAYEAGWRANRERAS